MRTLFCNSSYGSGGIGQHLAFLVEASRAAGELDRYYAPGIRADDPHGVAFAHRTYGLLAYTPLRFSPAWKNHVSNELYDRRLAASLTSVSDTVMGFVGKSLHTFRRARHLGASTIEVVAANSHVDNVARLHARAASDAGLRDTWLNAAQQRKTRREYEAADRIYVHSHYVRDSFLDAGISADKLVRTVLRVDSRFVPPAERPDDDVFRLVYVGRIDVTKGIDLLIDAFERLPIRNAELTLVGGWSSRPVRQRLERRIRGNDRIRMAPGDPLPALQRADVFVHPTYEDGFGYAPMEALACGVPAIVTEDTGMQEYVDDGVNGAVVPTGSLDAIITAIEQVYRSPLASTHSLLPGSYYDVPDVLSEALVHPS